MVEAETVKEAKQPEPVIKIRAEIEVETESLDRAIEKATRLCELLQEIQKIASSFSGKEESN